MASQSHLLKAIGPTLLAVKKMWPHLHHSHASLPSRNMANRREGSGQLQNPSYAGGHSINHCISLFSSPLVSPIESACLPLFLISKFDRLPKLKLREPLARRSIFPLSPCLQHILYSRQKQSVYFNYRMQNATPEMITG